MSDLNWLVSFNSNEQRDSALPIMHRNDSNIEAGDGGKIWLFYS